MTFLLVNNRKDLIHFFFQSLKNQSLERDGCKLASAAAIYPSVSLQECPSAFQFHVLQPPTDIKTW